MRPTRVRWGGLKSRRQEAQIAGRIRGVASYSVNDRAVANAVCGDFRRIHRSALIACVYRAAEWRHKEIELAAHELLQLLDSTSA